MDGTDLFTFAERLADMLEGAERVAGHVVITDQAAKEIALHLRSKTAALKRVRFIPRGSDQPIPPVEGAEVISEGDVEKAIRAWDRKTAPPFPGLVDAEVTG